MGLLAEWAERIKNSGARRAWVYFNNDYEGFAPGNALTMRRLLDQTGSDQAPSELDVSVAAPSS